MGFKKIAERFPLWNPHYKGTEESGGGKEYAGKSGDYLRGYILKVRTENLPDNVGLLIDVKISGKAYEGVKPGATLKGKEVQTLPDSQYKGTQFVTWLISDKYTGLIDDLTGKDGHFLKCLYKGPAPKSKYDRPAALWDCEVSEEPVETA